METPKLSRVYWAVLEGTAAAVLLLVGGRGSLQALQTASIATAVPFSLIMVAACFAMIKAFHFDVATTPRLLHISVADALPTPKGRRSGVSATLSGLFAVRDVDAHSCERHPDTGELTILDPPDPLGNKDFEPDEQELWAATANEDSSTPHD